MAGAIIVMYYRHFGLTGVPFQFTPTSRMLFMSRSHREALTALEWSLAHEPSGFTLMVGETGTGKTTLLVSLLARIQSPARIACVANPRLGFDIIIRDILNQLRIAAGPARSEMAEAFAGYMKDLAVGDRVVVIIDEAQNLDGETLEDLRLFANQADGEGARLHFVLAGQPGLAQRLAAPEFRQINERIGIRTVLKPLDRDEAAAYVAHLVKACGGTIDGLFMAGALDCLLDRAEGNPRRINLLCHNAMLAVWMAGEPRITLAMASATVASCGFGHSAPIGLSRWRPSLARLRFNSLRIGSIRPVAAIAAMAFFGLAAVYLWQGDTLQQEALVSVQTGGAVGDAVTEYPGTGYISNVPSNGAVEAGANIMNPTRAAAQEVHDRGRSPGLRDTAAVRVRTSDTLTGIAARYLGSEIQVDHLIAANPQLGDANRIYAGERLKLPATGRGAVAAENE